MASPREQLLALKLAVEPVTIPGVDGPLFLREITLGERQALDDICYTGEGKDRKQNLTRFRPGLLRLALMDGAHAPVFTEEDEPAIARMPTAVLEPVFDAALRLSALDRKSEEAIAGNSGAGQGAGASSPAPSVSA